MITVCRNYIIASAINYRTTEQLLCRNIINDKKLL